MRYLWQTQAECRQAINLAQKKLDAEVAVRRFEKAERRERGGRGGQGRGRGRGRGRSAYMGGEDDAELEDEGPEEEVAANGLEERS